MNYDQGNIDKIAEDFRNALDEVAAKYNMAIAKSPIRYSAGGFTMNVEAAVVTTGGFVFDEKAKSWLTSAPWGLGISQERANDLLGKEFVFRGGRYQLQGWNSRASRYPISAKNVGRPGGTKFPKSSFAKFQFIHEQPEQDIDALVAERLGW